MKRIALVMIMLLMVVAVSAQDNMLGLSAADALLLAQANSAFPDSFAFQYTLHQAIDLDTFVENADLSGEGVINRGASAFSATLKGQVVFGTAQTIPLDAEARLVDDTLFLNPGDGWQVRQGASSVLADIIGDLSGSSVDADKLAQWDVTGIDALNALLLEITKADTASYVKMQRLADEGQNAHFQIVLDFKALLHTDTIVDALSAFANAQGSDLIIYDHAQLAQKIKGTLDSLDSGSLVIDEYVGTSDQQVQRIAAALELKITPANGGFVDAPFSVSFALDLMLGQTQPPAVVAPSGATTVTAFSFAALPPLVLSESGKTQYLYFGTLDAHAYAAEPFEAKSGDKVTITARRWSLDYDPEITLLASDDASLAENEDHEATAFALADYDAQIADFAIPADGTYFVQVTDTYGDAGSFLLTIDVER